MQANAKSRSANRRSLEVLHELGSEVARRREVRGSVVAPHVDLTIAWAAHYVLDWIAWEATDHRAWPSIIDRFRLDVDPLADPQTKLRTLTTFAQSSCPALKQLEQIALAGKEHLRNNARTRPDVAANDDAIESAGAEAHRWLSSFVDQCGAFCA